MLKRQHSQPNQLLQDMQRKYPLFDNQSGQNGQDGQSSHNRQQMPPMVNHQSGQTGQNGQNVPEGQNRQDNNNQLNRHMVPQGQNEQRLRKRRQRTQKGKNSQDLQEIPSPADGEEGLGQDAQNTPPSPGPGPSGTARARMYKICLHVLVDTSQEKSGNRTTTGSLLHIFYLRNRTTRARVFRDARERE